MKVGDGNDILLGGDLTAIATPMEPNTIMFSTETSKEPVLVLKDNGDIFVKGRLAENDKEVVEAMREFLKFSGYLR